MKKFMVLFLIGILLVGISSASAIVIPKANNNGFGPILKVTEKLAKNTIRQTSVEGNFSGQFALKNESGYVFLGTVEGTYETSGNYTGSFDGIWNTTDENSSGAMSGWFWGHFYLGQISYDNDTYWFVGLYRVNTTSSEFYTAAIIFTSPCLVRYAAGIYD